MDLKAAAVVLEASKETQPTAFAKTSLSDADLSSRRLGRIGTLAQCIDLLKTQALLRQHMKCFEEDDAFL
jgi:hypothetical protein